MRRLRRDDSGEYHLVEFPGSIILPYVVLFHTRGAPEDEITFRDLMDGTNKEKIGHEKLKFYETQDTGHALSTFGWIRDASRISSG